MDILKRPIFYAAIICCFASVLSLYFINPFILLAITFFLFIFIAIKYRKFKYITISLIILCYSLGLFTQNNIINRINLLDNQTVNGDFLVVSEPDVYDNFNKTSFKVVNSELLPKNLNIIVFDSDKVELSCGDIVSATLKISTIKKDDEYRFFDYGNKIYATANMTEFEKTVGQNKVYKTFNNIRNYVKSTLNTILNGETTGLLFAITTGEKDLISDNFLSLVKETGISHIIAVSGMHLSIILAALFFIIDRLFYNKYIRTVLSLSLVFIICGICGFTMSVIRASVMFFIGAFAPLFKRDKDLLSIILTAFTCVLIVSPFAIVNISFLLSVLSTLAIIWVVPFYYDLFIMRYKINSKIIKALVQMIFVSIFAILFTLPVIIKVFGYVSVVSPITNILIMYPVMLALILNCVGLLISVVPFIEFLGVLIIKIAGFFCDIIIFIVNTVAKLPVTIAILPDIAMWISITIILISILYMYFYKYRLKRKEVNLNVNS